MTRTKSPSGGSTTTSTRSPPSPVPLGLTPVRLAVVPEWDEYEDAASGRKFFYNQTTKEKTWKPPRKPRTSADGKDLKSAIQSDKCCNVSNMPFDCT